MMIVLARARSTTPTPRPTRTTAPRRSRRIDAQHYAFGISPATKDQDTFLTSTNTGATKINSDDVTLDDSALAGKLLSLSKGDNVYLLKDRTGTLTYTEGTNVPKLAHTYTNTTDAGTATVTTAGSVSKKNNDLVLNIDDQKYTFDLSSGAKDKDTFLTSTNTGTTKIDAADVIVNDKAVGKILSLNNGDTVYLLKNGTGKLNHKYLNGEKTASIATSATVEQSGNDLVLNVGGVKYFFQLNPDIQDGYTYLDSENTAETKLDGSELGFEDDTSKMLSLNKGETVTLLKKENAGTLTYTGTKTLDRTYTNKTDACTAAVRTTGTVAQDGDALKLNIDGVTYTFDLSAGARNKDALLTSENTGETKIDGADITLNDEALDGSVLALNKGDKVYLLKNDKGTLTYDDADSKIVREYTYTNAAGDASIVTDATVQADGSDLVLNVDGVTYTYKLTAATKDGDTFIASPHADDTKIDSADVKLDLDATNSDVLSLSKGDKVYLLKKSNGTLAYTETGDAPALKHTYTNDDGTATIETTGTVQSDGKSLVLNVDGVTYTYKLAAAMKDGDTFITSPNADDTRIDGADVKLDDTALAGNILSLNKGDKVYLLKKDKGTLTYTGTNELTHTYTNETGDATIATTATVGSDGKSLVLNVDDVKYIFTLSSATKTDGTPMLMMTNAADTKIDASDVVLADSAEPLSLQKGDTVTLLTKDSTAGALTFADMAGKAQRTSVYTKTGEAGSAAITTTGTLAQDGKSLVMKVDGVKYTFALAPAAKADDTLLELEYTGDTTISKGDVTVKTSGFLRNLAKGDKVYLLKKTNGKLIATDITDTVNLPTIYGTIEGTVAEDASNNLVLTVTNAESLTDAGDSYKYIKVVEVPAENAGNTITVEACGNADRSAIAALAKDETDATELKDNTLTVQGKVKGRAVGANSVAGNATENNVTIGAGATVDGFVAGGLTADGTANVNIVTINGGTITGDVYGGYSEKEANDNIVNLAGGTIKGTVYGGYVPDAPAATSVRSKRSMPRRTLAATASSTSGNTLNVTKATTVGNLAKRRCRRLRGSRMARTASARSAARAAARTCATRRAHMSMRGARRSMRASRRRTRTSLARSPGARSSRRDTGTTTAISTTARTAAARRATRAAVCSRGKNLRAASMSRARSARARRRPTTPRPTSARATARMRRTSAPTSASAGCCRCMAARSTSMAATFTAARAATARTSRRARRTTSTPSTATASCSVHATRAKRISSASGTSAPRCSTNSAAKHGPISKATASRARRAQAHPSCSKAAGNTPRQQRRRSKSTSAPRATSASSRG